MQVEDHLSARLLVELVHGDTIRVEGRFGGLRDRLHPLDKLGEDVRVSIEKPEAFADVAAVGGVVERQRP